jgi:hypothetical protein
VKVSLTEMQNIFNDLIKENKSREEIASWALQRQVANDAEDLEFEPAFEKKKIWGCIIFLTG